MSVLQLDVQPHQLRILREILERHVPGWTVWAFGSRVTGRARRYSDLDLVIEAGARVPREVMLDLIDAFADSDLPWPVDVLDWSAISEDFQQTIGPSRVMVHPTPPDAPG